MYKYRRGENYTSPIPTQRSQFNHLKRWRGLRIRWKIVWEGKVVTTFNFFWFFVYEIFFNHFLFLSVAQHSTASSFKKLALVVAVFFLFRFVGCSRDVIKVSSAIFISTSMEFPSPRFLRDNSPFISARFFPFFLYFFWLQFYLIQKITTKQEKGLHFLFLSRTPRWRPAVQTERKTREKKKTDAKSRQRTAKYRVEPSLPPKKKKRSGQKLRLQSGGLHLLRRRGIQSREPLL